MPFRFGGFGWPWSNHQSRTTGAREQESSIALQVAPVTPSLSTQLLTPPCPSTMANERGGSSHSHSLIESHSMVINDGQFNQVRGLVINVHQNMSGNDETEHINLVPNGQSTSQPRIELNNDRVSQLAEINQTQDITVQKSNDIYERHLILKGRGFPLWIPEPSRSLHMDYRRTGVRIGDVGVITHDGGFFFLFNICLPHNDPVNPRLLPEHFSPISPPIEASDIEEFSVFKSGSHLASASIKRSQASAAISGIVFESSASEGAILTMPRGARSEHLGNFARFREYAAANVADWYKFVNGPRGREAKNGDIRLVVGFDKTTSWGIATFSNQTQQSSCRLRFGPSERAGLTTPTTNYTWEYSGVAEVRAGPDSEEIDELRRDSDPPNVQFENLCLFVRTLNVTLTDDVWADIHSSLGSVHVNSRNNHGKSYSNSNHPHSNHPHSNHPHSNNPGTSGGSNLSPSHGVQSRTKREALFGLQNVDETSDDNLTMFISGPLQSLTAHPSKVLNDILLARVPTAKMAITHDDDWSFIITQYDTLPDPHDFIKNILASRSVCEENGVVFLQPKEILNEMFEDSASLNIGQAVSEVIKAGLAETGILSHQEVIERTLKDKNSKAKGRQNDDHSEIAKSAIAISDIDYGPVLCDEVAWDESKVDLPAKSDIIIAVMGPTGAGKSTFINKAARTEGTKGGHGLESCTQTVQIVRCFDEQRNRWVVFVDTPGFNDTNTTSDLDILQLIANWLKLTYEKGIRLSGLLFFHRISDNRMGGSPLRYLKMFQNLCGKDALKNVMLVTTMWDEVTEAEGRNREKELSEHYWKSMLEMGSHASRFYNTTESAWDIISQLRTTRHTLLLQTELVDHGLELAETSAGRPLFSWLIENIKKRKEILALIEVKSKQNQFSGNRSLVEQERTVMEAALREANAQRKRYSSGVLGRFRMPRLSSTTSSKLTPLFSRASTPWTNGSASLVSLPASEYFPLALAVRASEAYGGTAVLQRTITTLKLVHRLVGLSSESDLQGLVGLVLSISEIVNNMYTAEETLVDLANKAGSFLVTLAERGSISRLSDSPTMKLIVERLTKEINLVLKVIKENFSQRTASDKAVVDECNKHIELACEISGIQIVFISQLDIARIEAKLNKMCGPIPPQSNQQATTAARHCTHCTNQEPGG